jgi:hypothetical protein
LNTARNRFARLRTQGSAGLGHAVEVSIGIRNQRSETVLPSAPPLNVNEHGSAPAEPGRNTLPQPNLAVAVSAEQGRAKDVPGIVHADAAGWNSWVAVEPALKREQQVFLTFGGKP